ncbi:FtsH protease activity modulator HflK [Paralimibaculum aggregatum]|uniref:Protein HflK n=1 Tax=Paralimibaculum aggregatum TaxID=3036245 RepID=A0ABQ6LP06_9RHOB|nr:FtsH protease activity modulator HflK [Limibaculum sp. NKW23]GMG84717.1 FtsH protease activity modulator HflK [Limibaculum sp. NKW23]
MPFNSDKGGGPWGGGGGNRGGGRNPWGGGPGGGGPGGGGGGDQGPDLDDLIRKGRDQLKVILGGRGGGGGPRGPGGGGRGPSSGIEKLLPIALPAVLVLVWLFQSFYRVDTSEQSVELFLGKFSGIGEEGLNFAPWPLVTYEIVPVTRVNTVNIGLGGPTAGRGDRGLMLTGDENIVDIGFQVQWNIARPDDFVFNLAEPEQTIRAVAESAMREVIGQREMKPILNRDRAVISAQVEELIQSTMDSYASGVNIVQVNFEEAEPPAQVIAAFRDVQAAAQDRDTAEKEADRFANVALAEARGEAARIFQDAEAYRAQVVNDARGEAARFKAILAEYAAAPEVTRKRMFLETMETVLGGVDKIIIDQKVGGDGSGGQGVVPYLPLNELRRQSGGENK